MSLAIGGTSDTSRPSHGTLWVDVRDYGAKADNGVTDNSVPFQAAIDDLALKLKGYYDAKGVVFIPSAQQAYYVNKSIWVDSDNIEIQGEGWGSRVLMNGGNRHTVFIFGIRRVEQTNVNGSMVPVQMDASHRPDLFGKLDTSVVSTAGTKWGIRTKGDSFVQFQAGPMSAGASSAASWAYPDLWSETSKLTVEFCIEPPDGQLFPTFSPICGIGTVPTDIAPFAFMTWDDPRKVMVYIRTSDIDPAPASAYRNFSFMLTGATAPYRIAVQFDLDNAVCTAFVNGIQVALGDVTRLTAGSTPPFAAGSGLKFATNDHHPFMIGASGLAGPYGFASGIDLRMYGLRLSNTIRYQNNGVGQAQKRVDSPTNAINDAYAYFGVDSNSICCLQGTDNPATSGRIVTVHTGDAVIDGVTSGLFLHTVSPSGTANNAIRNLNIQASSPYGQTISLGTVLEMTVENVKAVNGFNAVGSFNMTANYFVYLKNCWLDSYDTPYYGAFQLMSGRDIHFNSAGRVTMRHLGSDANWENVFVGFSAPVGESIFKARGYCYGGNYSIKNILVDFEGSTLSRAAFYCEAHCSSPSTSLTLKEIYLGSIGALAPLVMLRDLSPKSDLFNSCWLSVENLQTYTGIFSAAIDVDGPLWQGEVRGLANVNTTPLNHRQKWGSATGVIVRDTKYIAPPRSRSWYSGAHVLEVRSPVDGQFVEWRCVVSGAYGTATPPLWVGLNPVSVSVNGLAAYVLHHNYVTAALS